MNTSRREFFKKALASAGTIAVAPALVRALWSSEARAEGSCTFVKVGQGMAASVNYAEDKKTVKKDLQIVRNGVPFSGQSCAGCALYTPDPAGGKFGKCALFGADCVKPTSWCGSWNKKA